MTAVPRPRTDTTEAGMCAAIEADAVATRLTNVDAPVQAHDEADLAWALAPNAAMWRSAVVRADLAPDDADRRIGEILAATDAAGSGMIWWYATHHRPEDLPERLLRHGFSFVSTTAAMALDLARAPTRGGPPPELVIDPVRTEDDARAYVEVIEADRPENAPTATTRGAEERVRFVAERAGHDPAPMRWVGRVDGRPVATSRLSIVAGVAGLYGIVTVPDARGHGYGGAMTGHALDAGRALGMRIATLQATDLGLPVYRRLGFRTYFTYELYARPASR